MKKKEQVPSDYLRFHSSKFQEAQVFWSAKYYPKKTENGFQVVANKLAHT